MEESNVLKKFQWKQKMKRQMHCQILVIVIFMLTMSVMINYAMWDFEGGIQCLLMAGASVGCIAALAYMALYTVYAIYKNHVKKLEEFDAEMEKEEFFRYLSDKGKIDIQPKLGFEEKDYKLEEAILQSHLRCWVMKYRFEELILRICIDDKRNDKEECIWAEFVDYDFFQKYFTWK